MKCRHCKKKINHLFLDLVSAPPSNANLNNKDIIEKYIPLRVYVCNNCWLVQTKDLIHPNEIFTKDYKYFSSVSKYFLEHAKKFTKKVISDFKLGCNSFVIEIASNDGYLLKNFVKKKISCLGIEPTKSTAKISIKNNVPVIVKFFNTALAKKLVSDGKKADLIIGNNVFAHVQDINNFTLGLKLILKKKGIITVEFPHLLNLIKYNQFDTIYHEHYSYLSLITVQKIFNKAHLRIWKVEKIKTHGGSLRVYGCHYEDDRKEDKTVALLIKEEIQFGLKNINTYKNFKIEVNTIKNNILLFLIKKKFNKKTVIGYGAAAKGNTLLNYAGIKSDLIEYICDKSKFKQNFYTPGSHIKIISPNKIKKINPDYIIIFPWNISNEIKKSLRNYVSKKTKFVTLIPKIKIS